MKQASDYPITFGYKATDGVYYGPNGSVGPYHRGEDRAMSVGTPVIVNGVTIGLSGSMYQGPHLHIGRFVNGTDTAPNGGGFKFNNAVVTEVSSDDINGKFVRLQADGASWVYLHLSDNSKVKVGQILQGVTNMLASQMPPDETLVRLSNQISLIHPAPSPTDVAFGLKFKTVEDLLRHIAGSPEFAAVVAQYKRGATVGSAVVNKQTVIDYINNHLN